MTKYNYMKAITNDILDYISENVDFEDYEDLDELREVLNEDLWICDEVTGNASGSYTFNAWKAEENLCHNLDLLKEALWEFGESWSVNDFDAERADVTIRCYLLGSCIDEALEEIENDFNEAHKAKELIEFIEENEKFA